MNITYTNVIPMRKSRIASIALNLIFPGFGLCYTNVVAGIIWGVIFAIMCALTFGLLIPVVMIFSAIIGDHMTVKYNKRVADIIESQRPVIVESKEEEPSEEPAPGPIGFNR